MGRNTEQWVLDPLTDRELEILGHISDGMSDREIAQQLHLSLNTIKWHNRQIYSKLSVENRKQAAARASDLDLFDEEPEMTPDADDVRRHNLPTPVTSFVGRERQMAEVQDLLAESRLLTLCGPPGTGKTRLALCVAEAVLDQFEDGVFFVDLSPISEPQLVATTIGQVLGIREEGSQSIVESLQKTLQTKQILLLLDNFEQIIEAAPLMTQFLSNASYLKILVTSREILHVYGEQVYYVPPLTLPDLSKPTSPITLTDCEAVSLFTQRAQAAKSDFALTDDPDKMAVAEICVRLDGLPLAIELASVQAKLFGPQALLSQMESRFAALRGGPRDLPERHQTLRGAIDWSYKLLTETEQKFLARLSVFQGGRTIEAVEAVCCPDLPINVLDGLASLLNKNLLRHEEGLEGEPRFTMLETIHEYARHRLAESDEKEVIQRRHAEYFLDLAEQGSLNLQGPEQKRWLERLTEEHDNMRTALNWSLGSGGDRALALRLVIALRPFWERQGYFAEGLQWCERALEEGVDAPRTLYARALLSASGVISKIAYLPEVLARRQELNEELLAVALEVENPELIIWGYYHLGIMALTRHDYDQARTLWNEALTVSEDLGGSPRCNVLNVLGELARAEGEYERARDYYEESLTVARELGDPFSIAMILSNLGYTARQLKVAEQASELAREALLLSYQTSGFKGQAIATHFAALGGLSLDQGRLQRAARLFGATESFLAAYNTTLDPVDHLQYESDLASLHAQLDEESLDAALTEGRAMSVEEAVAYALKDDT